MKGFDDKALILFPFLENYDSKPEHYKYKFKECLGKFVKYLHSQDIQAHAFLTDDIAQICKDKIDVWVSPISKADRFFVSKYCEGMSGVLKQQAIEYPNIYADCARKDAGTPDMSITARFDLVNKHCKQAFAAIIPQYPIVVHFMLKSKMQYKVTSKPGDKRIRINISIDNFVPMVYMSGSEMNACDVLNIPYGNRAITNWEV